MERECWTSYSLHVHPHVPAPHAEGEGQRATSQHPNPTSLEGRPRHPSVGPSNGKYPLSFPMAYVQRAFFLFNPFPLPTPVSPT